jgi:hypothetical protein
MAVGALLTATSPAHAQQLAVDDAAGDILDPGLDITKVTFHNRDRAVVANFEFVSDRRGTVIVFVKARHGSNVRMVSQHPAEGPDKTLFLAGRKVGHCEGLSTDWDRRAATLKMRMPSRCLDEGNYGAIRNWALIEGYRSQSSDVDYAPEGPRGSLRVTDWIARG